MARIPQEELARIKREVAVAELARARGVELAAHGANLIGLCPFHDDHEPSFVVTPAKNLWHCLGACQAGGTNSDFVMRFEGVSFRLAAELLGRSGVAAEWTKNGRGPVKYSTVPKLPLLADPDARDGALLADVARLYHETYHLSPAAAGYMKSRGLDSPELTRHFRIGFFQPHARLPVAAEKPQHRSHPAQPAPEARRAA